MSCTSSSTCNNSPVLRRQVSMLSPDELSVKASVGNACCYESHVAPDASWVGEGQRLGAESLRDFLARTPRLAVAFSGGCDSSCLLAAAHLAGCEVKAYLVKTAFQADFEQQDALAVVGRLGVPFELVELDMFDGGQAKRAICANPPDRCYLCKTLIFSTIWEHARRDGFEVLVDGSNASDDPARRPGFGALGELGVVSPLRRAGMTKTAVRKALAGYERELGLPEGSLLSGKPSFPCLAVYVPEGAEICPASLLESARARGLA